MLIQTNETHFFLVINLISISIFGAFTIGHTFRLLRYRQLSKYGYGTTLLHCQVIGSGEKVQKRTSLDFLTILKKLDLSLVAKWFNFCVYRQKLISLVV